MSHKADLKYELGLARNTEDERVQAKKKADVEALS
jgi:hypothetical protein